MIKCHLSRIMGEKKLNIQDFADLTSIHRNTIARLYNETNSRIAYSTLERLCRSLNVQVGDLLEFIEEKEAQFEG